MQINNNVFVSIDNNTVVSPLMFLMAFMCEVAGNMFGYEMSLGLWGIHFPSKIFSDKHA